MRAFPIKRWLLQSCIKLLRNNIKSYIGYPCVPRWEPLVADFVNLGRKLEKLGFVYTQGKVLVLEEGLTQIEASQL